VLPFVNLSRWSARIKIILNRCDFGATKGAIFRSKVGPAVLLARKFQHGLSTEPFSCAPPYLQSEYTMLVPEGSSIRSIADADKPGIRIAAVRSHSSTMTLTSAIKQAEVILGENELAAFELLRAGRADALASTRQYLLRASKNLAGSRVLADYYGANLNRVVVPKGHPGWLAYVTEFVEEAKASGLMQKAIDRDGTFAFQVPPPGDPK
jgi:polar amino acid transport system substrate-binding protein